MDELNTLASNPAARLLAGAVFLLAASVFAFSGGYAIRMIRGTKEKSDTIGSETTQTLATVLGHTMDRLSALDNVKDALVELANVISIQSETSRTDRQAGSEQHLVFAQAIENLKTDIIPKIDRATEAVNTMSEELSPLIPLITQLTEQLATGLNLSKESMSEIVGTVSAQVSSNIQDGMDKNHTALLALIQAELQSFKAQLAAPEAPLSEATEQEQQNE